MMLSNDVATRRVTICRLETVAWKGGDDEAPPACAVVDLKTALSQTYMGKRYILGYAPEEGNTMPRLSAAALARLALDSDPENRQFSPVTMNVALVDVDAPNHQPPPEGWTERQINAVPAHLPCGWYRTPNGLRLVFVPKEPVPILLADSYLFALNEELRRHGVDVDPTSAQCLRLQGAPKQLNRTLPSDYSNLRVLDWHPANLEQRDAHGVGAIVRYEGGRVPLIKADYSKSDFAPIKRMLGAVEAEQLRTGALTAAPGQRHHLLVRCALAVAEGLGTNDPAVVYSLLQPSGATLFAGEARDWNSELIRISEWACAQVAGAKEAALSEKDDAALDAAEALGVSSTAVQQRLIISTGLTMYVYNERTTAYDIVVRKDKELLAGLRMGCPRLAGDLPWTKPSVAELLRDHGALAEQAIYTYTPVSPPYDQDTRTLYINAVRVCSDLRATFHADVDEWLRTMAGDKADELLNWLAALPKLDRPVCALYLQGPGGIGKGMLSAGIARLWSKDSVTVRFDKVGAQFQEQLKTTPLIWADEKASDGKSDSAVFRAWIGNDSQSVDQKNRDTTTLRGYPRLLVTANNDDAFRIREELDREDIDAIRVRIGYIRVDDAAAKASRAVIQRHADAAGCGSNLRDYTDRWVRDGAIAEHILYLAENRVYQAGERFEVDGWPSAWAANLGLRVGRTAEVGMAAAFAILEDKVTDAVRWEKGQVYLSAHELLAEWDTLLPGRANPPSVAVLTKTLKALCNGRAGVRKRKRAAGGRARDAGQATYYVVDASFIATIAEQYYLGDPDDIKQKAARESEDSPVILDHPDDTEGKRRDQNQNNAHGGILR